MTQSHQNISVPKNYLEMKHTNAILLENLNNQFLSQYTQTAFGTLAFIDSIIILKNNKVSLHKKNQKEFNKIEEEILTPDFGSYNQVKQMSHIPLLLLGILHDKQLTKDEQYEKLTLINKSLLEINNDLKASDKTSQNQKQILIKSIQFLSLILAKWSSVDMGYMLQLYLKKIHPLLEYNKLFATKIQLLHLNDITKKWIKKGLDLTTTRIILVTPHGPRPNRIEFQYYIDLLSKIGVRDPKNDRVYHVEQLPQHIKLITDNDLIQSFLAVSEQNKIIGKSFNKNQKMMFKDILSEKAPHILKTLPHPSKRYRSLFQQMEIKSNVCPIISHKKTISRL